MFTVQKIQVRGVYRYSLRLMPECDQCGSHVSKDFHEVFSNNDGELHSCIHCGTRQRVNTDQLRENAD